MFFLDCRGIAILLYKKINHLQKVENGIGFNQMVFKANKFKEVIGLIHCQAYQSLLKCRYIPTKEHDNDYDQSRV